MRPSVRFGGSKRGAGLRTGPRLSALRALCRFLGPGRLRVVVPGLSLASWGNSGGFRGVEGLVVERVDVGVRTSCASFHVGELAPGRLGAVVLAVRQDYQGPVSLHAFPAGRARLPHLVGPRGVGCSWAGPGR